MSVLAEVEPSLEGYVVTRPGISSVGWDVVKRLCGAGGHPRLRLCPRVAGFGLRDGSGEVGLALTGYEHLSE